MKTDILKVVVLSFIFVLVYNLLFFKTQVGLGTSFLFLALNIFFFSIKDRDSKNLRLGIFSSILGMIFVYLFAGRANSFVQAVNFFTALFFSFTALYFYKNTQKFYLELNSFLVIPAKIFKHTIQSVFSFTKENDFSSKSIKNSVSSSIVRGFIITIPIFIVLFFLLSAGDPIFEKLTQNILKDAGERIIVSAIIFVILLSLGIARFIEKIQKSEKPVKLPEGKVHELGIIAVSIILLFSVFIFIQFRYLFSSIGERELHSLGINSLTYSEYVRRGFFELILASALSSTIISYILNFLHRLPGKQKIFIQIFSSILTIETGLLLLSAAKRLFMYADAHGLTRARIFGFVFLIWLGVILLIFLIRIIKELKKQQAFAFIFTSTIVSLLIINVINVDGLIATKYRPTVNKEIDYFYLANLSYDANDSWTDIIEDSKKVANQLEKNKKISGENYRKLFWSRLTLEKLSDNTNYLINKYGTTSQIKNNRKWQSLNLSEYLAYQKIIKDKKSLGDMKITIKKLQKMDEKVDINIRQTTPLDRSTEAPFL